jgi:hypothetical protein
MRADTQAEQAQGIASQVGLICLLLFPALLTAYLAFNSGGMFEVTTAVAAATVLVVAAVAVACAQRPLRAVGPWGIAACGLLVAYAVWTLVSAGWSDAEARSLVAFDRVLLYLAVLALFACVPRSGARMRILLRGLLIATAAVALAGLASRLLADLWPTTVGLVDDRLSYPLTYWNTFGLLVGMACVLAVHHAGDEKEPATMRILSAGLLPLLAPTLLLTFSRGAILVSVVAIVVYLLAARPYGAVGAALAAAPTTALALFLTYSADLVHEGTPLVPEVISQAKTLALGIGACAVGAALLRALTLRLDDRLGERLAGSTELRRGLRLAGLACGTVALVAFVVAGGPGAVNRQYHSFIDNTEEAASTTDAGQRSRLLTVGNDGRRPLWEVALDAYKEEPLRGTGAGTFQLRWERDREGGPRRLYAYSLYLESLSELGIVGILLLVSGILALLGALAWRLREPDRAIYAAGLALALAWALHAGIDIDWQSPAVCVPVFAVAGLALARRGGELLPPPPRAPSPLHTAASHALRPALALACLAVAIVPARMALAQADLRDSVEALGAGDCRAAVSDARDSIDEANAGPRPYEVLAMCAARSGEGEVAVDRARQAVRRDPESWEPHYALALAAATSGEDPRPAALAAQRANPSVLLPREAAAAFSSSPPSQWRGIALKLPFSME